jgi:quercetin dioxygenase-like cupin family protein
MDTSQIIQTALLEWQPIRPDVAHGVYGRTLLAENLKVVLTRVEPGGMVGAHRDNFGHFFYFISGVGRVHLGDEQVEARAGLAARVAPGQAHAYANTSTEELVLISINIPSSGGGTEHQGEGNNLRRSLK